MPRPRGALEHKYLCKRRTRTRGGTREDPSRPSCRARRWRAWCIASRRTRLARKRSCGRRALRRRGRARKYPAGIGTSRDTRCGIDIRREAAGSAGSLGGGRSRSHRRNPSTLWCVCMRRRFDRLRRRRSHRTRDRYRSRTTNRRPLRRRRRARRCPSTLPERGRTGSPCGPTRGPRTARSRGRRTLPLAAAGRHTSTYGGGRPFRRRSPSRRGSLRAPPAPRPRRLLGRTRLRNDPRGSGDPTHRSRPPLDARSPPTRRRGAAPTRQTTGARDMPEGRPKPCDRPRAALRRSVSTPLARLRRARRSAARGTPGDRARPLRLGCCSRPSPYSRSRRAGRTRRAAPPRRWAAPLARLGAVPELRRRTRRWRLQVQLTVLPTI